MENTRYKMGSIMLQPGDRLFQYTDGVTEATNEQNELYGMNRLAEVLNRNADASPGALISAVTENIPRVTAFVEERLEALGCPAKVQTLFSVAVDELFGNIAHYAYDGVTGSATVRVSTEEVPKAACVTFIDSGKPHDPLAKPDPDISLSAEGRPIGGLGIFMVKKTMDAMTYKYKDGQNILTVKKNF